MTDLSEMIANDIYEALDQYNGMGTAEEVIAALVPQLCAAVGQRRIWSGEVVIDSSDPDEMDRQIREAYDVQEAMIIAAVRDLYNGYRRQRAEAHERAASPSKPV